MSERDELVKIVTTPESFDGGPASCGPNDVYAARTADAILAAGFRKPRTVSTEEEVEALPEGARLYSPGTTDFWILHDLSEHGGVKVRGTGGGYTFIRDFIRQQSPLVVIYEPEPQP